MCGKGEKSGGSCSENDSTRSDSVSTRSEINISSGGYHSRSNSDSFKHLWKWIGYL